MQTESNTDLHNKEKAIINNRQEAQQNRLREQEKHEQHVKERTQLHLEKLRAAERADSAERHTREILQKTWYQTRKTIREQSQLVTHKKKEKIDSLYNMTIEQK